MGLSRIYKVILALSLSLAFVTCAWSEESYVQMLSQGSCWYGQGETIKIASFNDNESIQISRDELELQIESLMKSENKIKLNSNDLTLHCGGYGTSLVIKTVINHRPSCLWLKLNKGKFSVRSLGGLENEKSNLCDGYKWGEIIVGIKSSDQKILLESQSFHSMIRSVSVISGLTIKVNLLPEYYGKELLVMDELKKQLSLRYIELNLLQHPIGESANLN